MTNDTVIKNLKQFRITAGLTSDQVAQVTGVSVDNLRRYENGGSTVPADVLHRLAGIYGHTVDDFFEASPPPPNLSTRPQFHLRTLPGVEIDEKKYKELQDLINKANADVRPRRPKKPTDK